MLFSQKLQWGLLLQDCFNIQKCDPILMTKDIVFDKSHFEVFSKEKERFFIMTLVILFWFRHALLHFVMLLLTYFAPRIRILSSTTHSPRFGDKNWNLLFTCHYSLSLFTCYCLYIYIIPISCHISYHYVFYRFTKLHVTMHFELYIYLDCWIFPIYTNIVLTALK